MKTKQFIQIEFIDHFKSITQRYPYISFLLIANGIEFLGKCLDERHNFDDYKPGLSKSQLNDAIETLMPKYKIFNEKYDFYKNLRNGFSHMIKPKSKIWLSQRSNNGLKHLSSYKGGLLLIAEDFYDDFEKACIEIVKRIDNSEFSRDNKMYSDFLTITDD